MKIVVHEVRTGAWGGVDEDARSFWTLAAWVTVWNGVLGDNQASERLRVRDLVVTGFLGEVRR